MSDTTTRGVRITVRTGYIEERSDPARDHYFFAYRVRIQNDGELTVQLMNRHWVITDGTGKTERVSGPGVVGHQPILAPGEHFEYTSFCPLSTPVGTMHGAYHMVTESGPTFNAEIAPFTLAIPHALN